MRRKPQPERPDVLVARRAAQQWGVLSLDELRACGLSRDAVAVRVRNGHLHPMHRAVYAVGHPNPCWEGRFLAAVKACGERAVLSNGSAAELWSIVDRGEPRPETTVPAAVRRVHPGIRCHRSSTLAPVDVTRHRGIPVTSVARTVVDLAATLDADALRRAVRRAQALHRLDLREVVGRCARRRGARTLAAIAASGPAPTRSELEDVVLDLVLAGGLEHPDVNVALVVGGRRVIPDFRWPRERLVVEADGAAWHDDQVAREADAERQALLEAHGERVVRVTWEQAVERPAETLARLRAAGAPPGDHVSVWRTEAGRVVR